MAAALRKFMESVGLREPEFDEELDAEMIEEESAEVHEFPASVEAMLRERREQVIPEQQPETGVLVNRILTAKPTSYADCKEIGNSLREGVPVILNLNYMPTSEAQRMVDFTLGLCYGLNGHFEQVGPKVMLLSPEGLVPEEKQTGTRAGVRESSWKVL